MTGARVIVSRDRVEMAERVAITVSSFILENPKSTIAVTVGATPTLSYRHLTSFAIRGIIDLSNIHFIVFDEFLGNNELAEAPHFTELSKTFFNLAHVSNKRINRPNPTMSLDQATNSFTELIQVRPPNLLILGLGPSGNIGWITSPTLKQGVHSVSISQATPEQNSGYNHCISLGFKQIMEADQVLLLAVAKNKAQVVASILNDKQGTTPAAWLLHNHPCVKLFLDSKAASLLAPHISAPKELKGFRIINDPDAISGKKIICFSPHPDDTSISAGASLAFLAQNNSVVSCCGTTGHRAFIPDTNREQRIAIREEEATTEAKHIDAVAHFLRLPLYDRGSVCSEDDTTIVVEYLLKQNPDIIFLPHTGDAHPTHRAVVQAVLLSVSQILTKNPEKSFDMYMYEGPWSLFMKGSYNTIISAPAEFHAKKLAAIRAHKSQTDRTPYDVAGNALSQLRGALVPEQDLSGFGGEPPKLEDRLELFYHSHLSSQSDVQSLLVLLNECKAPSITPIIMN